MVTAGLTGDYDQGCETGEGGNIKLHAMKGLRKLHDGVDPVPKASDTLQFVKYGAIAENQLFCFRIGTWKEKRTTWFVIFFNACGVLQVGRWNSAWFSSCCLNVSEMFCRKLYLPIGQTQDEEFHKRRFQQQFLVFGAEVRKTRDALRPLPDDLHGRGE